MCMEGGRFRQKQVLLFEKKALRENKWYFSEKKTNKLEGLPQLFFSAQQMLNITQKDSPQ